MLSKNLKKIFIILTIFITGCLFSSSNAEPTELRNIYISPHKNVVILSSDTKSKDLSFKKGVLKEPARIFFDIENAILTPSKQEIVLENDKIKNIKIAQFSTDPNIVRMVLYLNDEINNEDIELIQYKGNFLINSIKERPVATKYWQLTYYDKLANEEEGSFFAFYKEVKIKQETNNEKKEASKENTEEIITQTTEKIEPKENIAKTKPEETNQKEILSAKTDKNEEIQKNQEENEDTKPAITIEPKPILKEKFEPLNIELKPEILTQEDIKKIAQEKELEENPANIIEDIQKLPEGFILKSSKPICVNRFFDLKEPKRLVLDINANLSKNLLNQSEPVELLNGDNVKIALFEEGTSRFVIDNNKSNLDYHFIISPDSNSLVLTSNLEKVQAQYDNFFKPSEIVDIHTNTIDENSSEIIFNFSKPILHSFNKTDETFDIELYNVNEPDIKLISNLKKTKHINKVKIFKEEEKNSLTISIPIKSTYKLKEYLGFDANKLKLTMNDIVYPLKEVEIAKDAKVVIDAGHGGKDQGCSRGSLLEKDITLDIAKILDEKLKENKINSLLTRKDDTYLKLDERTDFANSSNADLFVSIHVNSCKKDDIKGIETHWYGKSEEGKKLAKLTQNNLIMGLNTPDRGTFRSMFYVVHHTKMPAVLVEVGFISNTQECALITSKAYQQSIAEGLKKAILLYLGYDYQQKAGKNEK